MPYRLVIRRWQARWLARALRGPPGAISGCRSRQDGFFQPSVKPAGLSARGGTLAAFIPFEGNARKVLETTTANIHRPMDRGLPPPRGVQAQNPKPNPDLTAAIDKKKKTITTKTRRLFS
jgi:hypothetical protein